MLFDDFVRGRVFDVFVGKALEAEEIGVFIQLVHVFIIVPHGSVLRRGRKDSAHVIDIFVQGKRLRKFAAFQNLLPILMLVLAQQLRRLMQMRDFESEIFFPEFFKIRVGFRHIARIIEVTLGVFVAQKHFKPRDIGIVQRFVLRNVFLFHQRDFLIQTARKLGFRKSRHVHIIIHRLLFGGGDDHRRKHRERLGGFYVNRRANVVFRVAVVRYRGAPRHDFRVLAHQIFRVDFLFHFQQIGIAVEMIEIFEQREIERFFYVAVLRARRKFRR